MAAIAAQNSPGSKPARFPSHPCSTRVSSVAKLLPGPGLSILLPPFRSPSAAYARLSALSPGRLKRSDFAPVSLKEIARLERNEVVKPHAKTLRVLAARLDVRPVEIETF